MKLYVTGNALRLMQNDPQTTSGSVNFSQAFFVFEEDWAGLAKTAVWRTPLDVCHVLIGQDGRCTVPAQILQHPVELSVAVMGVAQDSGEGIGAVITTNYISLGKIAEGADRTSDPALEPEPTIYEQILARVSKPNVRVEHIDDLANVPEKFPGMIAYVKRNDRAPFLETQIAPELWSGFLKAVFDYDVLGYPEAMYDLLTSVETINDQLLLRKNLAGDRFETVEEFFDASYADVITDAMNVLMNTDRMDEIFGDWTAWGKELSWYEMQYLIINRRGIEKSCIMVSAAEAEGEAKKKYMWKYEPQGACYLWDNLSWNNLSGWARGLFDSDIQMENHKISSLAMPQSADDAATKGYVDAHSGVFDRVIRTQAEFEALIASPTWLDAVSVCFVGDGGTLKFTRSDGQGCKIPQTVKQIQGINSATIEVTNFAYNEKTNKAALWYDKRPVGYDYWINGITVSCTGAGGCFGFLNCIQLTNCVCTCNSDTYSYNFFECYYLIRCVGEAFGVDNGGHGFYGCSHLVNCNGHGNGKTFGMGFYNCTNLVNCFGSGKVTGLGGALGFGFLECTQLANCNGYSDSGNPAGGFGNCTQLNNCIGEVFSTRDDSYCYGFYCCTQLTDCVGKGYYDPDYFSGEGYSFYGCSYLNGCKQDRPPSSTAFLGGTNTHVDEATVAES